MDPAGNFKKKLPVSLYVAAVAECHKIAPLVLLPSILSDRHNVVYLTAGSDASAIFTVFTQWVQCAVST